MFQGSSSTFSPIAGCTQSRPPSTSRFSSGATASARAIKDFSTILDTIQTRAPLRRNTDPEEVADTAVFLASDLGRGVTGNCLFVDAGMQIMAF